MKLMFNKNYFIAFLLLFVAEVAIAFYLKSGFIRHTVGDFLVVILIYCFLKSFLNANSIIVAIVTLFIAYIIELLQLTDFLLYLGIKHHKWANLIFGNSFSIQDLVAYTLGIVVTLYVERTRMLRIFSNSSPKNGD